MNSILHFFANSTDRPVIKDILKLYGAVLIGGWRLKVGGTYFKVKELIHMKFQNYVIFFLKIT